MKAPQQDREDILCSKGLGGLTGRDWFRHPPFTSLRPSISLGPPLILTVLHDFFFNSFVCWFELLHFFLFCFISSESSHHPHCHIHTPYDQPTSSHSLTPLHPPTPSPTLTTWTIPLTPISPPSHPTAKQPATPNHLLFYFCHISPSQHHTPSKGAHAPHTRSGREVLGMMPTICQLVIFVWDWAAIAG